MTRIKNYIISLAPYFESKWYPVLICFIVFIGNITGLEVILAIFHALLFSVSLYATKSIKCGLISILTFVYQISLKNGPNYPTYSDYYYTGWRLYAIIFILGIMVASVIILLCRLGVPKRISFKSTPLLLPLIILSAAFLLNGSFTDGQTFSGIIFTLCNLFVYFFLFLAIYFGLSGETRESAASHLAYVGALSGILVCAELIFHMLFSGKVFVDGSIIKESVALGWGIWNLIGVSLTVVIPLAFLGVHLNRRPALYFAAATVAYISAALTMSRNALLFGTLIYGTCFIISCFVGRYKKPFRITLIVGACLVIVFLIVFNRSIREILADYFERGLSDNGRYALWRAAFENFLKAPVFGRGFYGFDVETAVFGPLPKMAHNTVLELLSATGIVGLLAYGYYRVKSLIPVIKKPSLDKTFLFLSISGILLGSLLDNFIFNVYPVFFYAAALAVLHMDGEN